MGYKITGYFVGSDFAQAGKNTESVSNKLFAPLSGTLISKCAKRCKIDVCFHTLPFQQTVCPGLGRGLLGVASYDVTLRTVTLK